ncbi:hypothetical protein ACFVT5_04875 [Streptomyces sp. NPDC058001]|uniref:hypothetical protein n=1 Tax=Streptomyces sp. NPDC058001 TaxID=3346300 RepID=UPI0036F0E421
MTQNTYRRHLSHPLTGRILLTAALLTAVAAVPSAASAPTASSAQTASPTRTETTAATVAAAPAARGGTPSSAADRVADFYGAYIDAVTDSGTRRTATDLRSFYLTSSLRSRLAAWESRNHADGVLRAQDVPRAWRVTPRDSGAGHTWSSVRLTWGSAQHPTYTYLTVQSDLATKKISDIKER